MIRQYYRLAKPGIVYGNALTTIAAFFFAARWHLSTAHFVVLFIPTLVGISLVIASAAVFNNYLDRDIDGKMERTKDRALVTGAISPRNALIYGTILGLIGFLLLYWWVNPLTAAIAFFGFVSYVAVYGVAKRKSVWGAVVGSVPGAVPIVVGYTAITNHLDGAAFILFLILALWQLPHFYAIAMYRLDEYTAAGIPVLPAMKGMRRTKFHIVFGIAAFLVATAALWICGYASYTYGAPLFILSAVWLVRGIRGFWAPDDVRWARSIFLFSLIVLLVFSVSIALSGLTP